MVVREHVHMYVYMCIQKIHVKLYVHIWACYICTWCWWQDMFANAFMFTHARTWTNTQIYMYIHDEKDVCACAQMCVCVRNLWEGIVRHIGQTAEQQWESNLKRRAVKRKSTCSVTVPWTVDQAMCGTWHASEVRIHFEMTRTRNVALCAWAVSHARENIASESLRSECTVYTHRRLQKNRHFL